MAPRCGLYSRIQSTAQSSVFSVRCLVFVAECVSVLGARFGIRLMRVGAEFVVVLPLTGGKWANNSRQFSAMRPGTGDWANGPSASAAKTTATATTMPTTATTTTPRQRNGINALNNLLHFSMSAYMYMKKEGEGDQSGSGTVRGEFIAPHNIINTNYAQYQF